MSFETTISVISSLATLIGLFLIWYQVKSTRKDSITGSLISSINDHWKVIEERKMKLRTGEEKVFYPAIFPVLDELLASKYGGNISALALDFLFDAKNQPIKSKENIFEAIEREYAYQDITFNFYEEEFLAGKHLKLVDDKLWDYWDFYISEHFSTKVKQNHWLLRQKIGRTYPAFAKFVEQKYIK
jgi:hypothetical protein